MSTIWVRERTPRTTDGVIRTDCCGAFAAKRSELGAVYVKDRVVAAEMDPAKVRAVVLASGERVAADAFVNAAGAWSGEVAAMLG